MFIKINNETKLIEDYSDNIYEELGDGYYQLNTPYVFNPSLDDGCWKHIKGHVFELIKFKDGRDLKENEYLFSNFLNLITLKGLINRLQYKETNEYYNLWFTDNDVRYSCNLHKVYDSNDVESFENTYKSNCNNVIDKISSDGFRIFSPTLDDVQGLYPKKKMYKHSVVAGNINIFDIEIDIEKRICGGEYWIKQEDIDKIHEDDYIEFAIVDKNDVLGLFQYYGLSKENGDVLELTKFVLTDYIKKGNKLDGYHSVLYEGIKGTNILYSGLFMRCIIDSSGAENFTFIWRCYYYE